METLSRLVWVLSGRGDADISLPECPAEEKPGAIIFRADGRQVTLTQAELKRAIASAIEAGWAGDWVMGKPLSTEESRAFATALRQGELQNDSVRQLIDVLEAGGGTHVESD
jgi:hypothetical protein